MNRRASILASAAMLGGGWLGSPLDARAQAFPSKPIRIILPAPPGGGSDGVTRAFSTELAQRLGQPVIVEARPGASGNIASEYVARSAPDGYTLLFAYHAYAANPALFKNLKFNYRTDFIPLGRVAWGPMAISVNPSVPAHSVSELIALAKASPGTLFSGTPGNASGSHILTEMFNDQFGIKLVHVPYQGSGPMQQDLLGGRVHLTFDASGNVVSLVKAGRLRMLGVVGDQRMPTLPEVPTMREEGLTPPPFLGWYGIFAPKGTPPAIVDILFKNIAAAANDPVVVKRLADMGYIPGVSASPTEFNDFFQSEATKMDGVIRTLKITQD